MKGKMLKYHEFFPVRSAEYVVLHAHYRASRGKKPSSSFEEIANPQMALATARKIIEVDTRIWPPFPKEMSEQVILRIIEMLGHRLCTKDELDKILGKTVIMGSLPSRFLIPGTALGRRNHFRIQELKSMRKTQLANATS